MQSSTMVFKDEEAKISCKKNKKQKKKAASKKKVENNKELGKKFIDLADSEEDEGIADYKIGGYHAVHVGEIIIDRYVILQKLGWGHFSTVWLSKDLKYNSFVALKIQKSASHYLEAAYDEVEILEQVSSYWMKEKWQKTAIDYFEEERKEANQLTRDSCYCVQLLNAFLYYGPNGKHFVMVFEIMGVNLLEIIKRYDYKGIPIPMVRIMARQILIGLDYLHRVCKIIHTDLKPENVLVCLTKEEIAQIEKEGLIGNYTKYNIPVYIEGAKEELIKEQELISKKEKKRLKKKRLRQKKRQKKGGMLGKEEEKEDEKEESPIKPTNYIDIYEDRILGSTKTKRTIEVNHTEKPRSASMCVMKYSGDASEYEYDVKEVQEFSSQVRTYIREMAKLFKAMSMPALSEAEIKTKLLAQGKIDENLTVKIVDLGNGCWTYHHFTPQIQTRQYRSPETILGVEYGPSADIWSFACMIFELITGDFLFEPKKGAKYSKDDDHLALMIELLGPMPTNFALSGRNSKRFVNKKGKLKRITDMQYWPLENVLMEKYHIKPEEAKALSSFLLPMLTWLPNKRATARDMLSHPWLSMTENYNIKMTDKQYTAMNLKKDIIKKEEHNVPMETDEDDDNADMEDNSDFEATSEESLHEETDPTAIKYSLNSKLLNIDHGENPQFTESKVTK